MTIPTHITISDVLRGDTTMTPATLASLDNVILLLEGDHGARLSSVFAQLRLTPGLLNAWMVLHSYRLSENDNIRDDKNSDAFSRAKMMPVLTRIINDIHKENHYVLEDSVQYLLSEVSGSVLCELCHRFIRIEEFTSEFLPTYDLRHYCD